jgi:hypothetical protein
MLRPTTKSWLSAPKTGAHSELQMRYVEVAPQQPSLFRPEPRASLCGAFLHSAGRLWALPNQEAAALVLVFQLLDGQSLSPLAIGHFDRAEIFALAADDEAAGRGAQIILVKKAPTESGLQVRSHLPEGKPARKARAGRAKLKLHGFAGPSPGPLVGVQTARVQRARNEPEDR